MAQSRTQILPKTQKNRIKNINFPKVNCPFVTGVFIEIFQAKEFNYRILLFRYQFNVDDNFI